MLKKIGILTSGGDAPGMNATVIGAIKAGIALNKDMYVVYDGYKGLIEKNFKKVDKHFIEDKLTSGGTAIKTARLPEFKEEEVRKVAVKDMKEEGIEALIVIGGDGSYMGAKRLTEMGINCIGLPGTIDNDIASSDYTIGFDTALNTVVNAIDQIRDTMTSHNRCAVVEIMGNKCPDLTSFAAIATNADEVFTSWGIQTPRKYSKVQLEAILKELSEHNEYGNILRAKGYVDSNEGEWLYFDLVPGEYQIRTGQADFTGRICVIGENVNADKLSVLFNEVN